ncbi:MAG: hypothetical protein GY765_28925 [bacterium]|nr:hypothetical protein [bacterium]
MIQLRLYEGFTQTEKAPDVVVGSYFLQKLAGENTLPFEDAVKEKNSLKSIYKLKDVRPIETLDMVLTKGDSKPQHEVVDLKGRELVIVLATVDGKDDRFIVEVRKEIDGLALLKTELIMPEEKTAVLGFKDSQQRLFFLAFSRQKDREAKAGNAVVKPVLEHMVQPVYPKEALASGISGAVLLEGSTATDGKINRVQVLAGNPILAETSIQTVRGWRYRSWKINGKPEPVHFFMIYCFKLAGDTHMGSDAWLDSFQKKHRQLLDKYRQKRTLMEMVSITGKRGSKKNIRKPVLLKTKEPVYPETALQKKISGPVLLEGSTNLEGTVRRLEVLKGHPLLAEAAKKACLQWKYRNWEINGKREPVNFMVICFFRPDKSTAVDGKWLESFSKANRSLMDKHKKAMSIMELMVVDAPTGGNIRKPVLLKVVNPVFPKVASKGIRGAVLLRGRTGNDGNVAHLVVLNGHPLLADQSKKAISQWKYGNWIINGKPEPVHFDIICIFVQDKSDTLASPEWLDKYLEENDALLKKGRHERTIMEAILVTPPGTN